MTRKKASKRVISKLFSIILVTVAIVILTNVGIKLYRMMSLKADVALVEEELTKLKEENEVLNSTREKLEDPNYVTTYARGEYMFSKDDEKVFYLPSRSE